MIVQMWLHVIRWEVHLHLRCAKGFTCHFVQCEILKICYLISNSEKNTIIFILHYWTLIYLFLQGLRLNTRAFASRKSVKKLRGDGQPPKTVVDSPPTKDNYVQDDNMVDSSENSAAPNSATIPSRSTVLQACTVTSGLIAAFGMIIRQVGLLSCSIPLVFYHIFVFKRYFSWVLNDHLVILTSFPSILVSYHVWI